MGILDHLSFLPRNVYVAHVPYMEQQTVSKLGKEYDKTVLSSCLFNLKVEYIMQNVGLDEAQAGIKIAGRNNNNNNLRYADDIPL